MHSLEASGFTVILLNAGLSGCIVSFVAPLAAGSGIPEIKTYLNGVHIKGETDPCLSLPCYFPFRTLISAEPVSITFFREDSSHAECLCPWPDHWVAVSADEFGSLEFPVLMFRFLNQWARLLMKCMTSDVWEVTTAGMQGCWA